FITLLHPPTVLAQGESAEDPARALRITVLNDNVQARPQVCRVRVEWAQTIASDPNGAFDLQVEPWDGNFQTPDIWIDRAPFGVFDNPNDAQGRPKGNGDKPKVGAINQFHTRVHVSGAMGAQNVHVTFYAVTPPGVGDNGNWAPIGSQVVGNIPQNGFIDVTPVNWVPVVGKHTCLKVFASQQLGEISGGNNSAQENVSDFVTGGGSPVDPVIVPTAIRNPLDERRLVHVDVRGVPRGWRVHFPHSWVWLDAKAEKELDLTIMPYLDYGAYQERKLKKDAAIKIRGDLRRDYEEPQPPTGEEPGSRFYPIGGVLNNVHIRRRSSIKLTRDREAEPDEWTIAVRGGIGPAQDRQRIRVEIVDPGGRLRVLETKTDAQGTFHASFDLHYEPSLDADKKTWQKTTVLTRGAYRAQAEIFSATASADQASNYVFVGRGGDDRSGGAAQHDLPERRPRLEPLVRDPDVGERKHLVDDGSRTPLRDELVGALEVGARAHRRAEHGELLPPDPVERGGRVRAARRTAHRDPAFARGDVEGRPPRRLADVLDDDVRAAPAGRLLDGRLHVARRVVDDRVGAELAGTLELRVARRGHDHPRAERLRDRERGRRDAAADAPREHPLAGLEARARDEHPVGRLEHERECRGLLERQAAGDRVDVRRRHRDQLGVRAVAVVADHVD